MNSIDEKIQQALKESHESQELFAQPSLMQEAIAPFRGRRKWVNVVGLLYGITGFALFLWGAIECFHAETVHSQILWAGLAVIGMALNAFLKVFFWMEMHTNRILVEVKRVELLLLQKKD
ncbi:MAG: DUF6768 family protein [Verrucomicrobiota bacterium]